MAIQVDARSVVHPGAILGDGVTVAPFAVIEEGVVVGAGTTIGTGAVLRRGCRLGERNRVGEYAVLGAEPQDISFDRATPTGVCIGDDNDIREFVTIHRATRAGESTTVGNRCLLMVGCHLGHDVRVADRVIIANNTLVAGHVSIEEAAFISGGCALHQFIRVGRNAMVAGITKLSRDVPPFALAEGHPGQFRTINTVGLRRAGFSAADRLAIARGYRILYNPAAPLSENLARLEQEDHPLCRQILAFVRASRRGIIRGPGRRETVASADE